MGTQPSRGLLRNPADRRTIAFALVFFAAVGAQFFGPYPWVVHGVLWLVSAVFAFVGAVSTHNVIHAPMFYNARHNDMWRLVQTLWYGQPVSYFVPVHNHSHHKYAQTRKDLTRTTRATHRWQLVNLFQGVRWQMAAARDCKLYFAAQAERGRKIARQVRWEGRFLIASYAVLLLIDWKVTLLCVLLPHRVGAFCIRAINYLQHDGCDYDFDGYNHSRNFVGPVFNFLFLNNGYHTVHHLRPGWHWSTLPARHAELITPHIHPALDVPNFAGFAWRFLLFPGRRERFDGQPWETLPGGEGPDEPWDFSVAANYDGPLKGGRQAEQRAS